MVGFAVVQAVPGVALPIEVPVQPGRFLKVRSAKACTLVVSGSMEMRVPVKAGVDYQLPAEGVALEVRAYELDAGSADDHPFWSDRLAPGHEAVDLVIAP